MRESLQQLFTAARDMKDHFAAIGSVARAADEPLGLEAFRKLDSGVMQNLEAFGKNTDCRLPPSGQPFEREQRLMLVGLHSSCPGSLLAKIQKAADLVAKIRKHFKRIAPERSALHTVSYYIVLRYEFPQGSVKRCGIVHSAFLLSQGS